MAIVPLIGYPDDSTALKEYYAKKIIFTDLPVIFGFF